MCMQIANERYLRVRGGFEAHESVQSYITRATSFQCLDTWACYGRHVDGSRSSAVMKCDCLLTATRLLKPSSIPVDVAPPRCIMPHEHRPKLL